MSAEVTGPGIYEIDEADYHRDPFKEQGGSLSHSGLKTILEAPAKFHHEQTHGPTTFKEVFDFGSAAHAAVLGVGSIDWLDFTDWRTKAAKEAQAESRANGRTPRLIGDKPVVEAMAAAIKAHPLAAALLDKDSGKAEQSIFWEADDIMKRARIDWLPDWSGEGRMIVTDYKSAADASTAAFEKAAVNYGYHSQDAYYSEGIAAVTGCTDVRFVFVVQESKAPFLVNVVELSPELKLIGEQRCERGVTVYKQCRESGIWPGYHEGMKPDRAVCPTWAAYEHVDNLELWGMAARA